ncbi:MAG TPA: HlyD family efflux transporter periplasmic adaptor subunit [Planctomycetes bacterium]|nr:HlyD family efflux transporter periplasmic adaptor subunit [Fuerstiella sp.]HIK92541.1 HlyD family efflux transporter periplasmic adaptor subunit [Planctomycetota bacterium]
MKETTAVPRRSTNVARSALTAVVLICVVGQLRSLCADEQKIHVSQVTISLVRESDIPARDAGTLEEVSFTEGQSVRKGQIVAVLENQQQRLKLKATELNLEVARLRAVDDLPTQTANAQLKESVSSRRVKEVALKIAETEAETDIPVQVAAADTELRQLELQRAQNAKDSFDGSISASQIDRLKTAVRKGKLEIIQAQTNHRINQLKPDAERAAIEQKSEEIVRYQTLVKQEQKNLMVAGINQQIHNNDVALAELALEHRNIRAPFDGVIVEVERHVGEWVEPGAPVGRVIDLKTLRAEGFLQAQQASKNLVGRSVTIDLKSVREPVQLQGIITFVSPQVDPVNQQVRFWAEFVNADMQALPGMNASMVIE